jgi:hypothetical protein
VYALKVPDRAISSHPRAEMLSPRRGALWGIDAARTAGNSLPVASKEPIQMDDPQIVPLERKVELLRKIEPVLKDLHLELLDRDPKDEAEAVLVALTGVRAALAAEKERLHAPR